MKTTIVEPNYYHLLIAGNNELNTSLVKTESGISNIGGWWDGEN